MRKIFFLSLLVLGALSCNYLMPPNPPTIVSAQANLPQTEDAVPRVSAAEAKAALDSGAALIVDVRGADFFAQEHIAGAVNLPLATIENKPAGVNLKKDQWIITYCT
jgi:3-mercaptopyruvate sulfurtransferase SseA